MSAGPTVSLTARPTKRLFRLVLESHDGRALAPIPKKHEPASDIDTAAVDSLKALDPNRPIREADIPLVRRVLKVYNEKTKFPFPGTKDKSALVDHRHLFLRRLLCAKHCYVGRARCNQMQDAAFLLAVGYFASFRRPFI